MNHAKCSVTVADRVGENAQAKDIVYLIDGNTLAFHLLPDGIRPFNSSVHPRRNILPRELRNDGLSHGLKHVVAGAQPFVDLALDLGGGFRFEITERDVLKLGTDLTHAEPVRDGGVDIECLLRDPLLALLRERLESAHIMETVGQFDHDHADIAYHRQQHLADAFGLAFLARIKLHLAQFGYAVYAMRHFIAEKLANLLDLDPGVLNDVMEQAGFESHQIEIHVGQQMRDLKRMQQVRLARVALLAVVERGGKFVGFS